MCVEASTTWAVWGSMPEEAIEDVEQPHAKKAAPRPVPNTVMESSLWSIAHLVGEKTVGFCSFAERPAERFGFLIPLCLLSVGRGQDFLCPVISLREHVIRRRAN